MARRLALVLGLASLVVVGAALGAALGAKEPKLSSPVRVRVIEHATTDVVIDTGRGGDSSGDLLTFHNKVYNGENTRVVGWNQGTCIRMDPREGTWECAWTTSLRDGHITVEGPFYDNRDVSRLAVTGGTGMYRNARGVMTLNARHGGTEYAFIFDLIP